jgi:uncharacterized protein YodC (DUF2158 family)
MNRDSFDVSDLEVVEMTGATVVLASGGPLMKVECVEGDKAICSWEDEGGLVARRLLPRACLRSPAPPRPGGDRPWADPASRPA